MATEGALQSTPLRVERADSVTILTLDHQPSRNALSEAMLSALINAVDDASKAPGVLAVFTGADLAQDELSRGFSVGWYEWRSNPKYDERAKLVPKY